MYYYEVTSPLPSENRGTHENRFNGAQVSTSKPLFVWHPVTGATSYKIEFADNSAFTGCYSVPVNDTAYQAGVGLSAGMWYWHVSCSRNLGLFSPADSLMIPVTAVRNKDLNARTSHFIVARTGGKISIMDTRDGLEKTRAALYDLQGNLLRKAGFTGRKIIMEAPELPSGPYLLEIQNGGERIITKIMFR